MKINKTIIESICLLLALICFYEGIYKIAYLNRYSQWLDHAPYIQQISSFLKYGMPIFQLVLSFLLLFSKTRRLGLYGMLATYSILMVYILISRYYNGILFWPFHSLWKKPHWISTLIESLVLAWMAFLILVLNSKFQNKELRNIPGQSRSQQDKKGEAENLC